MNAGNNLKVRLKQRVVAAVMALFVATIAARGEEYHLHFSDPVGDATPYIDLTGMDFSFDPITGAYHARLFATSAQPFPGAVWVRLTLLNTDRLAAGIGSELFTGGGIVGEYAPAMEFDFSGINPLLTTWQLGDRVAPGQFLAPPINGPLPPEGGAGNTSARTFAVNGISFHYLDDMGIDQSSLIQPVPEPGFVALTALGVFLLTRKRRRSGLGRSGSGDAPHLRR